MFSPIALWIIIKMLIYGGIKNTSECIGLLRSSWIAWRCIWALQPSPGSSDYLLSACVWSLSHVLLCSLIFSWLCLAFALCVVSLLTGGGSVASIGRCGWGSLSYAGWALLSPASDSSDCSQRWRCCSQLTGQWLCHVLAELQHVLWCHETKKQVAGKGRENSLLFPVRAGELSCCGIMFFQCYKTHLHLQRNGCNVLFPGDADGVASFWGNVTTGLSWEHVFGANHRFFPICISASQCWWHWGISAPSAALPTLESCQRSQGAPFTNRGITNRGTTVIWQALYFSSLRRSALERLDWTRSKSWCL